MVIHEDYMPKSAPRTPTLIFRLAPQDQIRLDELCRIEGKKRPDIVREAVMWYLDNRERLSEDMRESKVDKRIKRMEDRLAALLAKANLDLGTLVQIMYIKMSGTTVEKGEVFKRARGQAVKRLRQKLQEDVELQELYKQDIAGPPEKAEDLAP